MLLSFEEIKNNKEVNTYLQYADQVFASIGYKEHGLNHAIHTANRAYYVLEQLWYDKRTQELAKVAGYMHDIGNIVSKKDHAQSGAIIALHILKQEYWKDEKYNSDIFEVFGAIGSHEDKNMQPPTEIAASVVLGDKTDVHHERLRSEEQRLNDTHSKVIAACEQTEIEVSRRRKEIILKLDIDTNICSIMEYFEIFTSRTIFCRKACNVLDCEFGLYINGDKFL
jgi:hypothetical protein